MADDNPNMAPTEGSALPEETAASEEEPVITGTLFLTMILLMLIFGFWAMMYLMLLDR